MSAPAKPTYGQSFVTTTLLIGALIVTFPFSFALSTFIRLFYSRSASSRSLSSSTKTVLVTGARTQKSLTVARFFWKAGYRVVLADEEEWGFLAASRFSRCISNFYGLPNPLVDHDAYERAIRKIIRSEGVQLWVPGSSAGATENDAKVAQVMREKEGIEVFIQTPREIEQLHNKDLFGDLVKELGFTVPESVLVTSPEEAVDFLHASERKDRQYIVKCTALDDQGRSDLTRLPFTSREKTRAHFDKMPRAISKSTPYVLQQFISGYEFCTHCHASNGTMLSFLSCPSSDMLMRYLDCRTGFSNLIATRAEEWTREFLKRWKEKLAKEGKTNAKLTGHFSFDFIVDSDGTLFPIECNPRIHTAIVLLNPVNPVRLAQSYFYKPGQELHELITIPASERERYSWLFHALPIAVGQAFLPKQLQGLLHPLLPVATQAEPLDPLSAPIPAVTISPPVNASLLNVIVDYINGSEKDPMLDWDDPMPFAAQHIQWIWLLARLVYLQGKGWSRVNVSTSRIFSC